MDVHALNSQGLSQSQGFVQRLLDQTSSVLPTDWAHVRTFAWFQNWEIHLPVSFIKHVLPRNTLGYGYPPLISSDNGNEPFVHINQLTSSEVNDLDLSEKGVILGVPSNFLFDHFDDIRSAADHHKNPIQSWSNYQATRVSPGSSRRLVATLSKSSCRSRPSWWFTAKPSPAKPNFGWCSWGHW